MNKKLSFSLTKVIDESLRHQLETYKISRMNTPLTFLDYIESRDTNQIEKLNFNYVPVINFLGIYDFLEGNEFFSSIKLKKRKKELVIIP